MSDKILGLGILPKMQNTKMPKLLEVWRWFFVSESKINWSWPGLVRHGQINSKIYMRNIFKSQIWSRFLCISNPHKQRILSLTALVSQLNIFHNGRWLVFFWFFKWSYIIFTSKKWQPNFCRNFYFPCIWAKKAPN